MRLLTLLLLIPALSFSQGTPYDYAVTRDTLDINNVDNTSDANKPVSTAQQTALDLKLSITSNLGLIKLARATVNGAVQASTTLAFESGVALSTHIPVMATVKYNSGTLGICVLEIDANSVVISATLALATLTSGNWATMPMISGIVANTGNLTAKVNTASVGASSIEVTVYGIKY